MWGTIRRLLARLFRRKPDGQRRNASWPTREEIDALPPFEAVGPDRIVEVTTAEAAERASEDLMAQGLVGFDTESKPTFRKGEISTGPHVAQFATAERVYVFLLHDAACRREAGRLIAAEGLKKVGFGLSGDLRMVRRKLRVEPREVHDIERLFVERGFGRGVGVKVGVAIALKRRFSKSKKVSTTNWMRPRLTERQLLYAANDAYAAFLVHRALTR